MKPKPKSIKMTSNDVESGSFLTFDNPKNLWALRDQLVRYLTSYSCFNRLSMNPRTH
jgi:hypothetical protein